MFRVAEGDPAISYSLELNPCIEGVCCLESNVHTMKNEPQQPMPSQIVTGRDEIDFCWLLKSGVVQEATPCPTRNEQLGITPRVGQSGT